jgi:hypothetical protein
MKLLIVLMIGLLLMGAFASPALAGMDDSAGNPGCTSSGWGWAEWDGSLINWLIDSLEGFIGICVLGMEG